MLSVTIKNGDMKRQHATLSWSLPDGRHNFTLSLENVYYETNDNILLNLNGSPDNDSISEIRFDLLPFELIEFLYAVHQAYDYSGVTDEDIAEKLQDFNEKVRSIVDKIKLED